MVNITGLSIELTTAGVSYGGCHTDGRVWDTGNNEIQARPDVAAVIAAHNKVEWDAREAEWLAKRVAARVAAGDIPDWSLWNWAQVLSWGDINVGNPLASARAAVPTMPFTAAGMRGGFTTILDILDQVWLMNQKIAQLEIALRDWAWSDLADYATGVITSSQEE